MRRTFFLIFTILLSFVNQLRAQRFSYIYIQGDKLTPFYVKMDGEMQPRYGKNYCILPKLEAGTIKLEVLFQQNAYPAQQFTILVPESGSRAFLLTKRESSFSLYDLQQQFYLSAGNTAEDDHLSALPVIKNSASAMVDTLAAKNIPDALPIQNKPAETVSSDNTSEQKNTEAVESRIKPSKVVGVPIDSDNREPKFLNITLANNHAQPAIVPDSTTSVTDTVFTQKKPLDGTFRNSDCPQPLPDKDFERIYKTMIKQTADEDRVAYLNSQLDNCYQTWQARTLGSMLAEDAARYTFLKNIYPHITDQQAFPLLDDMLRSDVWKAQFLQLTHR